MSEYTIEQLEKTFLEHYENSIQENNKRLEKFKKEYPDSEIPEHFLNDFHISKALHIICKEINLLKRIKQDNVLAMLTDFSSGELSIIYKRMLEYI